MVQNPVLPGAKVVAMYCYPVFSGKHDILAQRFVNSYVQHKAGYEHELWVVSNGGPPTPTMKGRSSTLTKCASSSAATGAFFALVRFFLGCSSLAMLIAASPICL